MIQKKSDGGSPDVPVTPDAPDAPDAPDTGNIPAATGDQSSAALWLILAVAALAVLLSAILVYRKT